MLYRFMELSAVLEPDKPPKTDKASILRDAARILSQLRVETQHLKDANCQLQETIKELKVVHLSSSLSGLLPI